jgi:hypothetical protein
MVDKSMIHIDHPDDERYDEIHIYVQERWKESEISGDEWRFSYVADVKRKGEEVISFASNRLEWLLQALQYKILIAGEEDNFDTDAWERASNKCDQPGCAELPTIFYSRLERFTRRGEPLAPDDFYTGREYRQFCERHRHRGDCGLDDADRNYKEIPSP